MQRTSQVDYSRYNGQSLLRFFHPGSNVASSINLLFRWPAPFVLVLGRLDQTIKTHSENASSDPYLGQELLALSDFSVQYGEQCRLVLRFC